MARLTFLGGLLVLAVSTSASSIVSLDINPHVVQVGGTVRVRCTVPRHPDNRWLTYGLVGYQESTRQLDGESARVTFESFLQHVPCDSGDVFCAVTRVNGTLTVARTTLLVSGCDSGR